MGFRTSENECLCIVSQTCKKLISSQWCQSSGTKLHTMRGIVPPWQHGDRSASYDIKELKMAACSKHPYLLQIGKQSWIIHCGNLWHKTLISSNATPAIPPVASQANEWHAPAATPGSKFQFHLLIYQDKFGDLHAIMPSPTASCVEGKGMAAAPPFMLWWKELNRMTIADHRDPQRSDLKLGLWLPLPAHCPNSSSPSAKTRPASVPTGKTGRCDRCLGIFGKDPSVRISRVFLGHVPCPPNLPPLWGASNASSLRRPALSIKKKAHPSLWKLLYKSLVPHYPFIRVLLTWCLIGTHQ